VTEPLEGVRHETSDRWEWIEHLVPIRFARVLWDSLFPKRFRALVLDALDGTPAADYAKPLTFCLGCWLLLYAAFVSFPGADVAAGIEQTLKSLPSAERHSVARTLGIDTLGKEGAVIPDTGAVSLDVGRASRVLHAKLGKRAGRIDGHDVAGYLESHGQPELGLDVRGYIDRELNRRRDLAETVVVMFAVFGLIPAWFVSHLLLGAKHRSFRQTRFVHMYNDSWLLVFFIVPFVLGEYSQQAFDSLRLMQAFIVIAVVSIPFWLVRTVWLYRATHGAPVWRVAASHVIGFAVALGTAFGMAYLFGMVSGLIRRAGF
jgi:hypothetical protein